MSWGTQVGIWSQVSPPPRPHITYPRFKSPFDLGQSQCGRYCHDAAWIASSEDLPMLFDLHRHVLNVLFLNLLCGGFQYTNTWIRGLLGLWWCVFVCMELGLSFHSFLYHLLYQLRKFVSANFERITLIAVAYHVCL